MIAQRIVQRRREADVQTYGSYIDGRIEEPAEGRIAVHDPSTSEVIATIADAGETGVDRAVQSALRAFPAWRDTPARDRGSLLDAIADRVAAHADEIAELDSIDTGNPITAMKADVAKGVRQLREAAGLAHQVSGVVYPLPGLHYTQREPWGVVGRMTTFNHPSLYACGRIGTALVAGNCVILKPSELAPLATLAIAELTSGIVPDGVISVVTGGPATGSALVRHPEILRISFTGSTPTALKIQQAAAESGRLKSLSFELGGKNPIVVFPDVDPDEVASAIVRGMNFTRVQGQSCGSTSRLVVHESIADDVIERVAAKAANIRVGPPTDPETEMGSMIDETARERCLGLIDRAIASGARLVSGGNVPDDPMLAKGSFLEPTIIDRVAPGSELANVEVFGPVLASMTWKDEDEAARLANEGDYGLTAAIWTQDLDRALRFVDRIQAGYVWVNDVETRFPAIPFGGWKNSGIGLEHGLEEILSLTRVKAVNIRVR